MDAALEMPCVQSGMMAGAGVPWEPGAQLVCSAECFSMMGLGQW